MTGHFGFDGKIFPMTVITPVSRWRRCLLRLVIWLMRRSTLDEVRRLRFIHYAHWAIVPPSVFRRAQPEDWVRRPYFLFITNYNGPWDQYIDSFSLVRRVRRGMNWIWSGDPKFTRAWPIRRFKRYIHYHELPIDAFYSAYPNATIRDIERALELHRKLKVFVAANPTDDVPEDFLDFARDNENLLTGATFRRAPSPSNSEPQGLQL